MGKINIRPYEADKDAGHVHRIWTDSKWIDDKEMHPVVDAYHEKADVLLGEYEGKVGTVVSSCPGSFNYQGRELPMVAITGVTAGLEFRRLGLAGKTTAHSLDQAYQKGAVVATLGAFDQGYYEKLGFGNFSSDSFITFDPQNLKVEGRCRPPTRFSLEDGERLHQARLRRFKQHGTCDLHPAATTQFELKYHKDGICLGYESKGEISHFLFGTIKGEHGPLRLEMFVYQNNEQLLELLNVIKTLSDQVRIVEMASPLGIEMQEFLNYPMRLREVTEGSKYENTTVAYSFFQARILRLEEAIQATCLDAGEVYFNLTLKDPIKKYLSKEQHAFPTCEGDYTLHLGSDSQIEKGHKEGLPLLSASINTFTRLWSGARSATSLVATDGMEAEPELVRKLDKLIHFRELKTDWDF